MCEMGGEQQLSPQVAGGSVPCSMLHADPGPTTQKPLGPRLTYGFVSPHMCAFVSGVS